MLGAYKAAWPRSGFHRHITIRQIYENSKNYGTRRQVSGEESHEGLEAQCTRGSRSVPDAGALLSVHSTTTHPAPLVQLSREKVRCHKVTKTTSQRDNTRQRKSKTHHRESPRNKPCLFPSQPTISQTTSPLGNSPM